MSRNIKIGDEVRFNAEKPIYSKYYAAFTICRAGGLENGNIYRITDIILGHPTVSKDFKMLSIDDTNPQRYLYPEDVFDYEELKDEDITALQE